MLEFPSLGEDAVMGRAEADAGVQGEVGGQYFFSGYLSLATAGEKFLGVIRHMLKKIIIQLKRDGA